MHGQYIARLDRKLPDNLIVALGGILDLDATCETHHHIDPVCG
jgi:hypothetical protein